MPLRSFNDRTGVRWEVWEAHAALEDRRSIAERRAEPRPTPDRRTPSEAALQAQTEGWLVFRSDHARRRHFPIPPAWDKMRDEELEALMGNSRPSGPRSRVKE